jgi:Sulfatase
MRPRPICLALTGVIYAEPKSDGVPIPRLPAGTKPNIVIILTDDVGWDDLGRNNPGYVHTPNVDAFIRGSTLFDNFYTSPQCAQTRASMLTGRAHPRTSTLLVNGGALWMYGKGQKEGESVCVCVSVYVCVWGGRYHWR